MLVTVALILQSNKRIFYQAPVHVLTTNVHQLKKVHADCTYKPLKEFFSLRTSTKTVKRLCSSDRNVLTQH